MNWLERIIVSKYLKGWLDKLPLNGLKTALGVAIIVLGAVAQLKPEYAGIINWLIDILKPYAELITDAGIITLITGVVHKGTKWVAGGVSE